MSCTDLVLPFKWISTLQITFTIMQPFDIPSTFSITSPGQNKIFCIKDLHIVHGNAK
jgi:hypothetical protein